MLVPRSPEASQPKVTFLVQVVELRWITSLASQLRCRSISRCPCEREPSATASASRRPGSRERGSVRTHCAIFAAGRSLVLLSFLFFSRKLLDCIEDLDSSRVAEAEN